MEKKIRTKFVQKDDFDNLFCYKCSIYQPLENFDINHSNWYREFKDRRCKKCKSEQTLKRKQNNRGKKDLNRLLLERWHGLKDRAKKNGLIVDFTWEFLLDIWNNQNGVCAISKIPMTFEMNNGRINTNVSVDRINSSKGYLQDNIQLVCMAVNQMKNDLEINELIYFCKQIIKNYEI
jgi:hypothetical protein